MNETPRHKVFVSYHHEDQYYKDLFVSIMGQDFVDRSVGDGDIDDRHVQVEIIRQRIRDEFIQDATVAVVLVGRCTWQRKHVDWEIGSSLRDTKLNKRCGLLGIGLPSHPDAGRRSFRPCLLPPRLADNCSGISPFARMYHWQMNSHAVRQWIHTAFERKDQYPPPNNARQQFRNNRSGDCLTGWAQ